VMLKIIAQVMHRGNAPMGRIAVRVARMMASFLVGELLRQ